MTRTAKDEVGGRRSEVGSEDLASDIRLPTSDSLWQGERVRLRAIEPEDWATYHAWNEDDEQARSLYAIPFPQSAEAARQWAAQEATRKPVGDAFRFVIENDQGEVVGDLTTHNCDARVGTFSYGISIRHDQRRQGYAAEAIALVLRYYFRELRYQKVTINVYSFNEPSIRLHERLGFQLEGRIRRTVFTDGQHHDELIFGLTAEEFAGVIGDG
jgi:RimJ/RimL family protein N-acetyltransferase